MGGRIGGATTAQTDHGPRLARLCCACAAPPGPGPLFADALSLFWAAWCQTARLPCQLLRAGIGRLPAEAIEGRERPPSPPPSLESDRSPGEISARLPRYVLRIGPPYRDGVGPERKPSARKPLLAELECARDMQRRRGGSSSIVNWSQEEEGVVPRRASELGGCMGCEGEICARPDLEPPEGMERIVAGPAAIDGRLVAPLRHHIAAASALSITASRHHASPPSHYYHYSGKQPPRTLRARFAITASRHHSPVSSPFSAGSASPPLPPPATSHQSVTLTAPPSNVSAEIQRHGGGR
jgi:hypothetical protein